MGEKIMTMKEAIERYVKDGDTVLIEGYSILMPYAAAHEIIRQRKRDLTVIRLTPDVLADQLIAAGCVKKMEFSWGGNPGVGPLRILRKAIEKGEIEWEEWTHYSNCLRIFAGAAKLSFMPIADFWGSDLPKVNDRIKKVKCPYTGKDWYVVPPINPDVTILHGQRADKNGNVQIWGIYGVQLEGAFCGKKLIVSVEEIVDESVIRSDPNRTIIPGFIVDALVVEPYGAHPSYAQGYYDRDNQFYLEWDEISKDEERTKKYLDEWVYGVKDRQEYIRKLGWDRIRELQPKTHAYAQPIDYGYYEKVLKRR